MMICWVGRYLGSVVGLVSFLFICSLMIMTYFCYFIFHRLWIIQCLLSVVLASIRGEVGLMGLYCYSMQA